MIINKKASGYALAFAAASLLAGCAGDSMMEKQAMAEGKDMVKDKAMEEGKTMAMEEGKTMAMEKSGVTGKCFGINSCKGHSDCATANSACKGQNDCAGKGWVNLTMVECEAKNGKFEA
jgi:hypothetical protein